MAKRCALSTGNLGGLPRNSVVRITDHPDMTSAVYRGRKTSTQSINQSSVEQFKLKSDYTTGESSNGILFKLF